MRKIIFILLFFVAAKTAKAQVSDTLVYLQTIVANKTQFVGQPFSVLRDSLKIQIKHFSQNTDIYYNIAKETSTLFSFYFPQNAEEMYLTYPCLRILWQTPMDANQSLMLYNSNNGGGWSSVVASFYGNGIIADIKVVE